MKIRDTKIKDVGGLFKPQVKTDNGWYDIYYYDSTNNFNLGLENDEIDPILKEHVYYERLTDAKNILHKYCSANSLIYRFSDGHYNNLMDVILVLVCVLALIIIGGLFIRGFFNMFNSSTETPAFKSVEVKLNAEFKTRLITTADIVSFVSLFNEKDSKTKIICIALGDDNRILGYSTIYEKFAGNEIKWDWRLKERVNCFSVSNNTKRIIFCVSFCNNYVNCENDKNDTTTPADVRKIVLKDLEKKLIIYDFITLTRNTVISERELGNL